MGMAAARSNSHAHDRSMTVGLSADRDHYPCFRQRPGLEWYASRARMVRAEPLPVFRKIGFDHGL